MKSEINYYVLLNGTKVKELKFHSTRKAHWKQSQWFWNNDKKVSVLYNLETGETKILVF